MFAFFSRSLFRPVSLSLPLSPSSSTSLSGTVARVTLTVALFLSLYFFFCSVPSHVFPLDDSILAVSSLAHRPHLLSPTAGGILVPARVDEELPENFGPQANPFCIPLPLFHSLSLFSGILAAGLWCVLTAPDSFGGATFYRLGPITMRLIAATFTKYPGGHGCQCCKVERPCALVTEGSGLPAHLTQPQADRRQKKYL
ncbi:hypothetical protein F5888DRAFT_895560 [Russula emetica]|nr:hypothetical protein F5888DRAFT_895560 [Russula emetica]